MAKEDIEKLLMMEIEQTDRILQVKMRSDYQDINLNLLLRVGSH